MVTMNTAPDVREKLVILSRDSQYDLACACGSSKETQRRRSADNKWIYPVVLSSGVTTFLFKTLISNECVNNCKYCPLRAGRDSRRCTLRPEELGAAFLDYYRRRVVSGLFLSSGVGKSPDAAMERINTTARLLRRQKFKGYIHLKIIPGASEAAICEALSLASAVSLNIEVPAEEHFQRLCTSKNYSRDVLQPIQLISRLTAKGAAYSGVKHTTQFVVGAGRETDKEIVNSMGRLYKQLGLSRVYFSAYQRGLGAADLPGESAAASNADMLTREHRLYQADWLIRKYGFREDEIPFEQNNNLSLSVDPKEMWAVLHPEFFPVNVNKAAGNELLRVPGLGPVTVERILKLRQSGRRLSALSEIGVRGKLLQKAQGYIRF